MPMLLFFPWIIWSGMLMPQPVRARESRDT
jgi:hypothetical protein